MKRSFNHAALIIDDYDEAIAFYTKVLAFELIEDTYIEVQKICLRYLQKR